jgi:hypothetical protein
MTFFVKRFFYVTYFASINNLINQISQNWLGVWLISYAPSSFPQTDREVPIICGSVSHLL